jgi:hypothetical protein
VEEILIDGFGLSFGEVRDLVGLYRKNRGKVVVAEVKEERLEFPEGSVELVKVGKGVELLVREWCEGSNVMYGDLVEMGCRWWRGRVVIPCWRDRGRRELWYWIARAIKEVEPKYINCPISKRGVVWGMDWYDVSDGYLYVCEGWKDAYKMYGIALLGKEVSEEQVEVIVKLVGGNKVRVLLDSDAWREGIIVGMRIGKAVGYNKVEVGFLDGLKDPGEGRDKGDVLSKAVFLGLGDGVGRVVEVMKDLLVRRVDEGLRRLNGTCRSLRVHI